MVGRESVPDQAALPIPPRMPSRNPTAQRAARAVIIGFAITLAIAWSAALWSPTIRHPTSTTPSRTPTTDPAKADLDWPVDHHDGLDIRIGFGYRAEQVHHWVNSLLNRPPGRWEGFGPGASLAGWPMKAFRSQVAPFHGDEHEAMSGFDLPPSELLRRGYPTNRLPPWMHAHANRRIPIEPIWIGLFINIACWSTAWILLSRGTSATARAIRRRRVAAADGTGHPCVRMTAGSPENP